jgi:octanoyl-[GcvH]:protein N-octanoyltransferase
LSAADPVLDIALSHALLAGVAAGRRPPALRIYRPGPTAAFGRLDALRPGFERAAEAARDHGYTPVLRSAGGHAALYDERCVVVDHVTHERDATAGLQARFADQSARVRDALRSLGADARIGELAGEYCPGEYSVHVSGRVAGGAVGGRVAAGAVGRRVAAGAVGPRVAGGAVGGRVAAGAVGPRVKVAGVAQRIVRHGASTSAVVVAGGGARLRAAIADVYGALELPVDVATAGALDEHLPGASMDDVERALRAAFGGAEAFEPDAELLAAARALVARHCVPVRSRT